MAVEKGNLKIIRLLLTADNLDVNQLKIWKFEYLNKITKQMILMSF